MPSARSSGRTLAVLHPAFALTAAAYLLGMSGWLSARVTAPAARTLVRGVVALVFVQLGAGVLNLVLLAPTWLQLVHLLLADLLWITLVLTGAAVQGSAAPAAVRAPASLEPAAPALSGR